MQATVEANHLGVRKVHDLEETVAKKGLVFGRARQICEPWQPEQAKKVLVENMRVPFPAALAPQARRTNRADCLCNP